MAETETAHPENRALVERRIGQIELSTEMFDAEQQQLFSKLLTIVDRNPQLQWIKGDPNHNLDFCLIEGNLEPVREFALKAAFVAKVNIMADATPLITKTDYDLYISVPVTVSRGGRSVTMNGGSSIKEVSRGKKNPRGFHDALARAQTRGTKIAMEALLGFAFVNLIIKAVFGGYQVEMEPGDAGARASERVGGTKPTEAKGSQEIGTRIHRRLDELEAAGTITAERKEKLWLRVQLNIDSVQVLENIEQELQETHPDAVSESAS